jgi:peroxiredoxin
VSIKAGDRIPSARLKITLDGKSDFIDTSDYFAGRRIVLFGLPGAFTPTCSISHLPGYIERAAAFFERGIDAIACVSVNDIFVMDAWGESMGAGDIGMLADGNGDFNRAMGLELDSRPFCMGWRSRRYALVANDGLIEQIHVEQPGEFRGSAAEYLLARID